MFLNRNVSSEHATMGWAWDEDELVQETAAAAAESSWSLAAFHAPQIWRYMSCMADLTRVIESCCWHRTTDGQHADDAALDYTCSTSVPQQPATVCTLLIFHASSLLLMQPFLKSITQRRSVRRTLDVFSGVCLFVCLWVCLSTR